MEKIWLPSYASDVPADINPDLYPNIPAFIADCVSKFADKPCIANMGKVLTFKEVDALSDAFAAWLQNNTDLVKGDRVAVQMPNILQYPIVVFGILKAGMVVVNTNPLYTPREMEHQFKDSGAKAIIILENFANHLQEVLPNTNIQHVIIAKIGDMLPWLKGTVVNLAVRYIKRMVPSYSLPQAHAFTDVLEKGKTQTYTKPTIQNTDLAFLQYTGGTTGVAKGAMLTHRNIIANSEQIAAWIRRIVKDGEDIVITPLPLYHIFSLTCNLFTFFKFGGLNVLITNPRDIKGFLSEMGKYPFTFLTGVNTLFNAMLNSPELGKVNFNHLKLSVGGAMALQQPVVDRWTKLINSPLLEGYGLTEASPVTHFNPIDGRARVGFIGLPLSSTDVKLLDDNGNEVEIGAPGELCISGPQVMAGYWNRPDETEKSLKDGYLRTGDIATVTEDGFFKIVDRKKDMILVSGFNVYPNEVEEVVAMLPGVLEVACIGVPDSRSTEAVKVFIVPKDPTLTIEQVQKHCLNNLTGYKQPKYIEFRKELPKTNVGKILRRTLRDEELAKTKKDETLNR